MCVKMRTEKGTKNALLLVAAVILVSTLHQEGHQIPNHPSFAGSHHIRKY